MYSNIVVPLDGSKESENVLPQAQGIAEAYNATLHLIQVVSRAEELDLNFYADQAENLIKAKITRSEDYLKEVADRLQSGGTTVKTTVLQGSAAEGIIDYSRKNQIDLIIISTRGQGGIQRFLLGSTTDRVIRSAHLPVLAIPPEDQEGTSSTVRT